MSPRHQALFVLALLTVLTLLPVGVAQPLPMPTYVVNFEVGFAIDVPEDWTVTTYEGENRIDIEDDEAIVIVDAIALELVDNSDPLLVLEFILEGLFDAFDAVDGDLVFDQTLGGLDALRVDFDGELDGATVFGTLVFTFDEDYVYYVVFAVDADLYDAYEETLLTMVDSFRFGEE